MSSIKIIDSKMINRIDLLCQAEYGQSNDAIINKVIAANPDKDFLINGLQMRDVVFLPEKEDLYA